MTLTVFLIVILAATLHASWNFAAKRIAGNLSAMWLGICLASVISWPFALLVVRPGNMTLAALACIIATGVLHAAYFALLARAYESGDMSLVYPVARGTGVAGTAVVASIALGEVLSLSGILGITAICGGTALMGWSHRIHQEAFRAFRYALGVGVSIIAYSVVDKLGVARVHPIAYISAMFTLTALLLMPYMMSGKRAECVEAYRHLKPYIGLIGVGSIFTYLLILFAFRLGPVSYIVAAREFAVVIGCVMGVILLNERLSPRKVAGIAAIIAGLVLVKIA
jgi:drug/metabolite transporter (DMT)-like permease